MKIKRNRRKNYFNPYYLDLRLRLAVISNKAHGSVNFCPQTHTENPIWLYSSNIWIGLLQNFNTIKNNNNKKKSEDETIFDLLSFLSKQKTAKNTPAAHSLTVRLANSNPGEISVIHSTCVHTSSSGGLPVAFAGTFSLVMGVWPDKPIWNRLCILKIHSMHVYEGRV